MKYCIRQKRLNENSKFKMLHFVQIESNILFTGVNKHTNIPKNKQSFPAPHVHSMVQIFPRLYPIFSPQIHHIMSSFIRSPFVIIYSFFPFYRFFFLVAVIDCGSFLFRCFSNSPTSIFLSFFHSRTVTLSWLF